MQEEQLITSPDDLRKLIGNVPQVARDKVLDRLDHHADKFIGLSPFLCLATRDVTGRVDVSPRGDAPGFVNISDPQTLYIPDRPGNRRVDSMMSILGDPNVALIFFVPGISETLRVHGLAALVTGAILETMKAREITPRLAIRVSIKSVYFHCGKALIRSGLWKGKHRVDRNEFPTFGKILSDQIDKGGSEEEFDDQVSRDYEESLY